MFKYLKKFNYSRLGVGAFAVLAFIGGSAACAGEGESSALSFRGFGTLGVVRSSNSEAEFVRDLSQPDGVKAGHWSGRVDSLLGGQVNWALDDQWQLAGQLVSRYRYDGSYRPEVTLAFAQWMPRPDLSVRAGRIGTNFFMFADSRLIGYSSLTVRPSGDYFATLPFYYVEGADAEWTLPVAESLVKVKAFAGLSREKLPMSNLTWDLDGSRLVGGHVEYNGGPWTVRLGYAELVFNHDLPLQPLMRGLRAAGAAGQQVADKLTMENKQSRFLSIGAVYDRGPLTVEMLASRTLQESEAFQNQVAGSLLAGYRLAPYTPYVGLSWSKTEARSTQTGIPNVGSGALLNSQVAMVMNWAHIDQKTLTLGVRWDFRPGWAFKVQQDFIRGTAGSVLPYRAETSSFSGSTNVTSLTLDFVF